MASPADRRAGARVALLLIGMAVLAGACGRDTARGRNAAARGDGRGPAFEVVTDSLLGVRDGSTYRLVRLRDSKRVVHEAWLRFGTRPESTVATPATAWRPVLILGGIGTGRRAAEITPCPPGFVLVALDQDIDKGRQFLVVVDIGRPVHGDHGVGTWVETKLVRFL